MKDDEKKNLTEAVNENVKEATEKTNDVVKAASKATKKPTRDPLLNAAAFLDGMVAVSGLPVMVLQGKFVNFPSGASLAAYQLCYFLPQLLSSLVAEQLAARCDALALLMFTLMCTAGSSVVLVVSLSKSSLALFFLSRFLNGVLRHDKTYFGTAGSGQRVPAGDLGAAARYGMMAGMLVSGVAGDLLEDAVEVAQIFTFVEVLATVLVLLRFLPSKTAIVPVQTRRDYAKWLTTLWAASPAAHHALAALAAVLMAASVNQVAYPLVGPDYGLPYAFTGAHLCFTMALQMLWMPHILAWAKKRAATWQSNVLLPGTADNKLTILSAALLLVGCAVAPPAASYSPYLYYPVSTFLVDIPAGILTAFTAAAAQEAFGKFSSDGAKVGLLIGHATQLTKSFAAPLRISTWEYFSDRKDTVRYISLPLMAYTLVYARTQNVAFAVAALAIVAVYLVSPTNAVFDGDL